VLLNHTCHISWDETRSETRNNWDELGNIWDETRNIWDETRGPGGKSRNEIKKTAGTKQTQAEDTIFGPP